MPVATMSVAIRLQPQTIATARSRGSTPARMAASSAPQLWPTKAIRFASTSDLATSRSIARRSAMTASVTYAESVVASPFSVNRDVR